MVPVNVHPVSVAPWPSDLEGFLDWVRALNRQLRGRGRALAARKCFDLLHAHDWLVGAAGQALADELDLPLVCTVHATEHGRHSGHVRRRPQSSIHALERRLVRRADALICCSNYMREHLAEVFDIAEEDVAVIANGVPPAPAPEPREDAALRARLAGDGDRLVVLVGRLVYEKGFQVALEALAQVIGEVPGLRFALAGSGPHEQELRDLAGRWGLRAHGTFLGWTQDAVLSRLYRAADVCVVPSLYEPFGLVALEAMAAGCPCLVADTGGLSEVVGEETALRFPAGDPAALAHALRRVLSEPGLGARLASAGSVHVRRFGWDAVAGRTLDRYGAVLEG